MRPFKIPFPHVVLSAAIVLNLGNAAHAQNSARVEKTQRTVEKQTGRALDWTKASPGTSLGNGERVRTGKRSKADVRFADKSLLRLGQLSRLELRGGREVKLLQGELLLSALSPARILAGSATAAIKGTVPLVRLHRNGDVEFALYTGEIDITTSQGTVTLRPGEWIKVYADGSFSEKKAVPPLYFTNGTASLGLLIPTRNEPYVGSDMEIRMREDPSRQLFDMSIPQFSRDATDPGFNPYTYPSRSRPEPSPTPEPTLRPTPEPTPTEEPTPEPTLRATPEPTLQPTPEPTQDPTVCNTATADPCITPVPTRDPGIGTDALNNSLQKTVSTQDAPENNNSNTAPAEVPTSEATSASGASTTKTVAASTGEEHINDADYDLGSINEVDVRGLGAYSSGGGNGSLFASRLALSGAKGQTYYSVALTPLRLRSDGDTRTTALVTQALVLYRAEKYDVQVGRQLIWNGPMQASLWGSMLRQGGRNTFDALRLSSHLNSLVNFDVGYLYDAYPNLLVNDVPGRQRGYYGRVEVRDENYAIGLNLLRFKDTPTDSTTGTTLDFVVPLASDAVEVYGEVGRDTYRRKTRAFGLNFPILYEKTGIDMFLETANVRDSDSALGPGREYAARFYRDAGSNKKLMIAASKFRGGDTRLVFGLVIGGHATLRDQTFENFVARN